MTIIHVVDDDKEFQVAISRLLQAAGYGVRTYDSAGEFLLSPADAAPGCLLLDVGLPGPSGLDLQEALVKRGAPLPIVFLTGQGDIPTTVKAMKAGALDFLTKPVQREALLGALRNALAAEAKSRVDVEKVKVLRSRYGSLTARELEVFERVVAGRLNKQIAHELGTAERTVKAHRARVMEKMQAESIAELVQIAGLLQAAGAIPAAPKDDRRGGGLPR